MRYFLPRKRFLALITTGLLSALLPVVALQGQTPTAAQMQVFQGLPADQQQAILQQVASGQLGGGAVSGPMNRKKAADTQRKLSVAEQQQVPARLVSDPELIVVPVIQAEDTVIVQIKPKDAVDPSRFPAVKALSELIQSRNPFRLDAAGQLLLPGIPPIVLAGLEESQANQRLAADPGLEGLDVKLIRMPLVKAGLARLKPFGYDLFDEDSLSETQTGDVPVPADYVVGAGDEIRVQLFGGQNRNLSLTVGRDGSVSFPDIGPVHVGGLSFNAAKSTLESRVVQQMIGVRANVTMGDTRSIRVFVMGEAKKPGSYTISGLGTMTSALYASGGIKPIGSLRDIQLKRQGSVVRHLDLYDLLIRGDTSDDAKLLPGDVILIPPVGPTVTIDGEVKRPGIYEIRSERDAADLVALAGGLTPEADSMRSSLTRIDEQRRRVVVDVDLARGKGRTQKVRNGDVLRIEKVRPQIDSGVSLSGAVHRPGLLSWHEGLRLTDVIASMDELKQDADPNYVLIRRESGLERKIEVVSADLGAALRNPAASSNLLLKPRDQLTVFEMAPGRDRIIKSLLEEVRVQSGLVRPTEIVRIGGRVKAPGDYPLESGMKVGDLVRAGGSLDVGAYSGVAELARYEVNETGTRQVEVIQVDLAAILRGEASANVALRPFDYLLIKEVTGWSEQQSVTLLGEFRFPGTYPIRRGESLHEVINRAGGLTADAFRKGSVFTRLELREREQKQLDALSDRMQADLTEMSLKASVANQAGAAQAMQSGQTLLTQIKQTKAVGRLVIDLPGVMDSAVNSDRDVLLRNGDLLVVPKPRQEVTVIGEVQSATSHLFAKNLGLSDYLLKSGGLTKKADKSKIYVVRADGNVVANQSSWVRRSGATSIQPGDTIVVPLDTERMPKLPLWQSVTQIVYNLAVSLAAIRQF